MEELDLQTVVHDLRRRGNYEGAAALLLEAIARSDDHGELAELYGMLGGTRRDQGDLVAAAAAYDVGARYESDGSSSYNALNRLVTRVVLAPDTLSDVGDLGRHETLEPIDVRRELSDLESKIIQDRASGRADDHWAAGDLAVTAALTGHIDIELQALEQFHSLSPPLSAYTKYGQVFAMLAALDTPRRDELLAAQNWLVARTA